MPSSLIEIDQMFPFKRFFSIAHVKIVSPIVAIHNNLYSFESALCQEAFI
jgi:hypothetical protein